MPESARILPFRSKVEKTDLSAANARESAERYLGTPREIRSEEFIAEHLLQTDTLMALCSVLRAKAATAPSLVCDEGASSYSWLLSHKGPIGLFDEREFFLGELALITAGVTRLIGKLVDSERWLDRAEAAFRQTVNPAPLLANTAYARLALKYHQGRHEDVLELVPWVESSFDRLSMDLELAKARFLKTLALREVGRAGEAIEGMVTLCGHHAVRADSGLHSQVLVNLAGLHAAQGDLSSALSVYQKALPMLAAYGRSIVGAELKWAIGDTYRTAGRHLEALTSYQGALEDYQALEMVGKEATLRLAVGQLLLAIGRSREAEWQILAALPTIDQEKMVPEGFAAVALLRESVHRRETDAGALAEVREYLKANG